MMLSARNDEADVLKSFDTGIDDYMSKPRLAEGANCSNQSTDAQIGCPRGRPYRSVWYSD